MIKNNEYLRFFNKNKDKYIKGKKYLIRNGPVVLVTKASLILKNNLYFELLLRVLEELVFQVVPGPCVERGPPVPHFELPPGSGRLERPRAEGIRSPPM